MEFFNQRVTHMSFHSRHTRRIAKLETELAHATTYERWHDIAQELDQLEGTEKWRQDDESDLYHNALLRQHLTEMRAYQEDGNAELLFEVLQESAYRHMAEISDPNLYKTARAGTKHLITEYLDQVVSAMHYICDNEFPGVTPKQKLESYVRADHVFGRPALMMSGGAALGIYNLGVVYALLELNVLPTVISGSSMGSFIAVVIGSRTRTELVDMFHNLDELNTTALQMVSPMSMLKDKVVLDSKRLFSCIKDNTGSLTFQEAYKKSGLIINLSVSPTRARQKPRLLNYLTTPNVMLAHGSLASCAIPHVFAPVTLMYKDSKGNELPYMGTETWSDGSIYSDIPRQRMSRLHNVNKAIVSQSNPHVIPFMAMKQNKSLATSTRNAILSSMKAQTSIALDFARSSVKPGGIRSILDKAHAVAVQQYHGDINIHLPPRPSIYKKILTNPDAESLQHFMLLGQRATWPQVPCIQDQTRINRAFDECIAKLRKNVEA